MSKLRDTRGSNSGSFLSTVLKFGSFIAKYKPKFKTASALFEFLNCFQVIMIKLCPFRLQKCYFGVLAVKYNKVAFQKMLTQFWTAISVKYENVIIGAIKHNMSDLELRRGKTKVRKQAVHSLYLFEITK